VLKARNTLKNIDSFINDIVNILKAAFNSKDYDKIFKILFTKSGNTSFYALYLARYFKENHFLIEYNIKKDKIFYIGNINDIKESYKDFKERIKKESEEYKKTLSKKEVILMKYKSIEKLDKESLTILFNDIKERLHKTI
jgi:beta-galactosidase GanA